MQRVNVHGIGGTFMKCKGIRKRKQEKKEAIRNAIQALGELNPEIKFEEDRGCISTSCKTADELLQIKMPEGIVKVRDPKESARYGFVYVKIGKETVSINGCGIFSD